MKLFTTHFNHQFTLPDPNFTALFIYSIFLLAIFLSLKRSKETPMFMNVTQTNMIRGLGIAFIVLKHVDDFLILPPQCFPVYLAEYGVTLFFFLSGYGLMRSFNRKESNLSQFIVRRIKRIFIPYWIVTVIFLMLDYLLLAKEYSFNQKVIAMLGINISRGIQFINGTWFLTLLLFFYCVFIVSTIFKRRTVQLSLIFLIPVIVFFIEKRFDLINRIAERGYFWPGPFLLIFPFGCLVGLYYEQFKKLFDHLREPRLRGFLLSFVLLSFFIITRRFQMKYGTHPNMIYQFTIVYIHQVSVICFFTYIIGFFSSFKITSGFLVLLGSLSYEIFLLHWPFMVKYDFILFRVPLKFSFLVYFAVICLLSYSLRKASDFFVRTLF